MKTAKNLAPKATDDLDSILDGLDVDIEAATGEEFEVETVEKISTPEITANEDAEDAIFDFLEQEEESEVDDIITSKVSQSKAITTGEDVDEAIVELLEIEEESAAEVSESPVAKTIEAEVTKKKTADVTAAKKKVALKVGSKPSEAISTLMTGKPMLLTTTDVKDYTDDADKFATKVESSLADFDNAPKKVGEKLINTFKWLNGSVKLSRYTKDALTLLIEKGEATTKVLETFYVDGHLGLSTARSQAGQMRKLLPLLNIASLVGDKLTINEESTLVQHYKTTSAVPAAAE
jgi:hypothetical protein